MKFIGPSMKNIGGGGGDSTPKYKLYYGRSATTSYGSGTVNLPGGYFSEVKSVIITPFMYGSQQPQTINYHIQYFDNYKFIVASSVSIGFTYLVIGI